MKTIYSGAQGVVYNSKEEALAAVEVNEISASEYGKKFDSYIPDYDGRLIYLDDGEIIDSMRDNNGEGGYTVSYGKHSEVVEKKRKASGYGDCRVDYWEIEEQIWDDDDPEDMTIVDSTVLGYRKC